MMKINWKVRLQNKAWLMAMLAAILAFVYQVLGLLDIVPPVSQDQLIQLVGMILNILVALGIIVDPTTAGMQDSERAMTYTTPKK